jgi:hypothetical protein
VFCDFVHAPCPTTRDEVLDLCRRQAEANRSNPGFMVFTTKPPGD